MWLQDRSPVTPDEEEELTQRREMCGGEVNRGVWELLECLEKEAIMGDDDGRDPKDYNRRAKNRENTLQSKEYCCLFHLFV